MKRVLITHPTVPGMMAPYRDRFSGIEVVTRSARQFYKEAELLDLAQHFDGILSGDDEFTESVLRSCLPRLRVISKWGVGLDSIDLVAARSLGIRVCNTPGVFGEAVAEVVLGYMLLLSRDLHRIDQSVRAGEWPKPEREGLFRKRLGLIGFGSVGQAVFQRAQAFGMSIQVSDPYLKSGVESVQLSSLKSLLPKVDFLCLCCSLTLETQNLIGQPELDALSAGSYLINVARGSIVDESALIKTLEAGGLAGAALDVYEVEPLPEPHPLRKIPNLILGSHNANNVREANIRATESAIDNLLRHL